jgi:hypothetical protein
MGAGEGCSSADDKDELAATDSDTTAAEGCTAGASASSASAGAMCVYLVFQTLLTSARSRISTEVTAASQQTKAVFIKSAWG